MYGRYARGFADPSNPNASFQLTLDRGLWGGLPLAAKQKRLAVRVLFFDQGNGRFEVHYDGSSGEATPPLIKVQKKNSKTWKEVCAEVTDGHFDGRGPGGSDIWIQNADNQDDILGGLEIADASLDDIALNGCNFSQAA
eukprot:g5725.t1